MATRMGIPNLIKSEDDKDDLTKSDSEKAQVLADYFSSVFTREPEGETPEKPIRCSKTIELCTINPSTGTSKLKKLKTFKSPGPDGLHPRVLHELVNSISTPLSIIFNTSLTTSVLPTDWKTANVSAIHKKGNKNQVQNYRPTDGRVDKWAVAPPGDYRRPVVSEFLLLETGTGRRIILMKTR
ncbi:hypothetical protein LSAT2_000798 [Lamellibrachia satsuma]|nr:hypothetical protein LSAT2_000798 [Lamellibrachia satsuma]